MKDSEIIYFEKLLTENSKINGDCIEWTGKLTPSGYGSIYAFKRAWVAHRIAFLIDKRFLPDFLYICHKCNNKKCINPDHLYAGTAKDNSRDLVNSPNFHLRAEKARENRKKTQELRKRQFLECQNKYFLDPFSPNDLLKNYIDELVEKKFKELSLKYRPGLQDLQIKE